MTQERYARDIRKRVNMQTSKLISTPMSSCEKLLIVRERCAAKN
jgi:hypothetical protein